MADKHSSYALYTTPATFHPKKAANTGFEYCREARRNRTSRKSDVAVSIRRVWASIMS